MPKIYVSLGSNIEPARNLQLAISALREQFPGLLVSPAYRSKAVGMIGDDFLNMAVAGETSRTPSQVTDFLRTLENRQGRDRSQPKFSSRTLDLDLLMYGDDSVDSDGLRLPHSDIIDYAFVLQPLADIAGDVRHPVLGLTLCDLLAQMKAESPVSFGSLCIESLELPA